MRIEDAVRASALGADAIGMVFYRAARRYIPPDQARAVIEALPPFVTPVGVFVDTPAQEIREAASAVGLGCVQLHGHENADCIRDLEGFTVLKAVRVVAATFQQELSKWRDAIAAGGLSHLRGLVLDTAGEAPGGTGAVNDWETIRRATESGAFEGLPPIIAAGGLTPLNVREAQSAVRPWAVDVSSGVEAEFGKKSAEKIAAFIAAVRQEDADRM